MDAEKLLADMLRKGFLPECRKGLIGVLHGFCKEKKMVRAIKYLERMVSRGCYPDIVTYNTMLTALCKDGKLKMRLRYLICAIDFLVYMINRGCKPTETSYRIPIEGIACEGMAKEALELFNELCNKGLMKRSSAEQVAGKCSSK